MRKPRKNFNAGYGSKNKKMNKGTYEQRQMVMNYIYEAKRLLGEHFKRVDVRITEKMNPEALAVGSTDRIVWVDEKTLKECSPVKLRHVVFHELGHAIFRVGHDEKSFLMQPRLPKVTSKVKQDKSLLELCQK